jgi:polysaccharide export outer membrane protein
MTALAVLLALLAQAPAPVEPPATVPPASTPDESAAPAGSGEYEVGPGDVLEITVYDNPDLSRIPTVQTSGAISYPLLGDVQVAGLTVAEIQRKITNLLQKDYLVNPQVEVKVREYNSQYVSVVGEVNRPGRKPLRGKTRLIDILIEAGGFTRNASQEVLITRTDGVFDGGSQTIAVQLSGGADPSLQDRVNLELPLRNGDIITASPKQFVTVEGEVTKPSRYAIEGDLTVSGAVSLAGGLTRFGSNNIKVRRTDPDTGAVTILEVDLKDVRNGKEPDIRLQPNDVVSVSRRLF